MFKYYTFLLIIILGQSQICQAITQTQYTDYVNASKTIGKWLSKSTSQNDFLSATPISLNNQGLKYIDGDWPTLFNRVVRMQTASDYGFSIMHAPLDTKVVAAYGIIGTNTATLPQYLEIDRFHMAFSFGQKYDLTLSYLTTNDQTLTGFGAGFKNVFYNAGPFFMSYRMQYAQSTRDNFFTQQSLTNDISASIYLVYFDLYGGVRHSAGIIKFVPSSSLLALPDIKYVSTLSELEYFYGIVLAATTKLRITIQANKVGEEYSIAAKASFRFNSLLPDFTHLFSSPAYIRKGSEDASLF